MMHFLVKIVWSLCILPFTSSARILFLHPFISKSHANFNDAIATSLLEAGHQIKAFTGFPDTIKHPNYTEVDTWRPEIPRNIYTNLASVSVLFELRDSVDILDHTTNKTERDCIRVLRSEDMQRILKSKEKLYDLLIVDIQVYSYDCFLPIADFLNIPVIGTSSMRSWRNTEWVIGNPYNPAVIPFDCSYQSYKMTFMQRLKNIWDWAFDIWYYYHVISPKIDKLSEKYFPTITSRTKLSLMFVNSHSALNPRPLLPKVISIGGIHMPFAKPLPKNLQTFIDTADHGVILFSLGSLLQSHKMPAKALSVFRQVFAQLPQRVIWKTEADIELLSENILLSRWLPQRDILAHENIVAFITHAGLAGIYEALYSAVPMLLLPIFFDQMSNAAILEQLGLGINLDLSTITEETLKYSLDQIINGTKYRERAKEISILMKDQPLSPQETAVYWVEYILRQNETRYVDTTASKMPLYQYLLLDVIGLVLVVISTISFGFYYLVKHVTKYFHKTPFPPIDIQKK